MNISSKSVQSLVVISVTLLIAGAAMTQSLFRDLETSEKSSFAMGTLDLSVNGGQNNTTQSIQITNVGDSGTLTGSKSWSVKNTGSLPGRLNIELENIVNQENGCNEPEALVDATCDDPGIGLAELGRAIRITLSIDDGSTITPLITTDLSPAAPDQFRQQWAAFRDVYTFPAAQERVFILSWELIGTDKNNELQSDSITFDIAFILNQFIQ